MAGLSYRLFPLYGLSTESVLVLSLVAGHTCPLLYGKSGRFTASVDYDVKKVETSFIPLSVFLPSLRAKTFKVVS